MNSFEPTARRSSKAVHARAFGPLLATVAVLALAFTAGAAPAAPSVTYQLRGYEISTSPATFVGFWQQGAMQGIWAATIAHDPLRTKPNQATTIDTGAFVLGPPGSVPTPVFTGSGFTLTFSIASPVLAGQIDGGARLVARPVVARPSLGGHLCAQSFLASGDLTTGGSFEGTLTHYGTRVHGVCDVSSGLATFEGSVTVPLS